MTTVLRSPIVRCAGITPHVSPFSLSVSLPLGFRILLISSYPRKPLLRPVVHYCIPHFWPDLFCRMMVLAFSAVGPVPQPRVSGFRCARLGLLGFSGSAIESRSANIGASRFEQPSGSLCVVTLHARPLLIKRLRCFRTLYAVVR